MRTVAYLQIVPRFNRSGKLTGISAKRVASKQPMDPLAGAVTLKLNIEIPDKAFTPINVDIDVPLEALEPMAQVRIAE